MALLRTFIIFVLAFATSRGDPSPQARALEGEVATEGCRIGAMANQTVVEGSPIKLRCPLDFGTTCIVNQITWYRAHTEDGVRSVAVSEVSFDPLLFYIQAVFKEDEGWYWCVATNSLLDDNRDIEMVETGAYLKVTARTEQPVDEQPPPTTTTTTTTRPTRRLVSRTTHRPRQSQQKDANSQIEALLGTHLGSIYHQLSELNKAVSDIANRVASLEDKTKDL